MGKASGCDSKLIPRCAGTHAHELSQVIGHMLYFFRSSPQGDVREAARKPLMPMLPDTLGSRAFLKTASLLTITVGPHAGEPVLSVIGSARQDSGGLADFKAVMEEFQYKGALFASEIEIADDLLQAGQLGYALFGAGGFMGDSRKAWDPSK